MQGTGIMSADLLEVVALPVWHGDKNSGLGSGDPDSNTTISLKKKFCVGMIFLVATSQKG